MNYHGYNLPMATPSTVNAATQTLIQLVTPATRRAWLKAISVSGKDTDGTKVPCKVDVVRQNDAGTGGTAITPVALVASMPASLCSAIERPTTEPADSGLIVAGPWYVTTVGGLFDFQWQFGEEIEMSISQRLGLRIVTAGVITGVLGSMRFGE